MYGFLRRILSGSKALTTAFGFNTFSSSALDDLFDDDLEDAFSLAHDLSSSRSPPVTWTTIACGSLTSASAFTVESFPAISKINKEI